MTHALHRLTPMPGLRRSLRDVLSVEALRHARYIPRIISRVRPWPQFLLTYMRLRDLPGRYQIRGLRFDAHPIDVSTLAVIFIKEDYGVDVPGKTVVDIGANIGAFALLAAGSPEASVYAYEPVSATYDQLMANIRLNDLEGRVQGFNMAVTGGREDRVITISEHGSPFSTVYGDGSGITEPVKCIGLDDVFKDNEILRCDVLKLDCEGAEFEILYASQLLSRVDHIWMEYHERDDHTYETLLAYLVSQRFHQTHHQRTGPNTGNLRLTSGLGS